MKGKFLKYVDWYGIIYNGGEVHDLSDADYEYLLCHEAIEPYIETVKAEEVVEQDEDVAATTSPTPTKRIRKK